MTEIEEKSLKAQLTLLEDIKEADNMIIHIVQSTVAQLYSDVVDYISIKEGQETVELKVEDFNKIRKVLKQLRNQDGFGELNSWIREKYIEPKKEKLKILSMLK
jgi:CHAD domain-containing protein